ncbi:VWA domain-containing protein [Bifidobacterium aquikefiricola]|uniref:VWA domain-containing protein n=1 Tax=Bifidobacterium aquikefiricola TaxID=3059038 RepID=A0AB39U4P3_9BIFI
MSGYMLSPSLGWIGGGIIAALLLVAAIFNVVLFIRRRNTSDTSLVACIRRSAIAVLIAIMALTPSVMATTTSRAINATDVYVAVDVTGSMAVNDAQYGSNDKIARINAASKAVTDITALYPNASFAGLSFGASASLDVPLTPDSNALTNWADTLRTEPTASSSGSNLDAPLDKLLVNLKATHDQHPDDSIILYVITDGEQTSSATRRSFSSLRGYINDGFVLGVGSTAGAQVPVTQVTASGNQTQAGDWVIDPSTKQPAVSKMDPKNLAAMADEISGRYIALNAKNTLSNSASKDASKRYRVSTTVKKRRRATPVVWPYAIAAGVLLLWEFGSWLAMSRRML